MEKPTDIEVLPDDQLDRVAGGTTAEQMIADAINNAAAAVSNAIRSLAEVKNALLP